MRKYLLFFVFGFLFLGITQSNISTANDDSVSSGFSRPECSQALSIKQKAVYYAKKTAEITWNVSKYVIGYTLVLGAMAGAAYGLSHLAESFPENLKFLNHLITPLLTMGIVGFGQTFWAPINSAFGHWSHRAPNLLKTGEKNAYLESLWKQMQIRHSLNAQMARNLLQQFIANIRPNFDAAFRSFYQLELHEALSYSRDQIADACIRARQLNIEILPEDESISRMVHSAFTDRIPDADAFARFVLERIYELDPNAKEEENRLYYLRLLKSWLYLTIEV